MATAPHPTASDAFVGRVLRGKYRIVRRLGEGGWGMVFEAEHLLLRKNVAIKLLHSEFARDEKFSERFRREALAASQIGHPNIIEVYDLDATEDGIQFMVLELLSGQDLSRRLATGRTLPVREAVAIFHQVASALAAAHAVGIVHRDLKPDNIVVGKRPDGTPHVKIVDFGIAKLDASLVDAQGTITQTGTMLGTPYYMSPEQIRAERNLDHRTDLYSLGVIMYEALAGTPPFEAPNLPTLVARILYEPFEPLGERRPDLPTSLTDLVGRLLERESVDRPSDMTLVATTLELVSTELARRLDDGQGDEDATLVMSSDDMPDDDRDDLERTLVEAPQARDLAVMQGFDTSGEHPLGPSHAAPVGGVPPAPSSGVARRAVDTSEPNIRVADAVFRPDAASKPWHENVATPLPITESTRPVGRSPIATAGAYVVAFLGLVAVALLSYFVVLHL